MEKEEVAERIGRIVQYLEENGRYGLMKKYYHHGNTTIYEHCKNVAFMSCRLANIFRLKINYDWIIRGALLHDYYLYDWHVKEKEHSLHGFRHPATALKNAQQEFSLEEVEKDIILYHMFPLTILPPMTVEGWIVCVADKVCAIAEVGSRR